MAIKFIDLFAGIGGFRLGLEAIGAECVFSSEIDEHARMMYKENFGDIPYGDITKIDLSIIPDFDILCAGFPCQTFSIGGQQQGFLDSTRGTLFFDICRILEYKKPKAFILENVQNLEKHDKGNTLFIILNSLNYLGYSVSYKILNARDFNTPQNRERIIIIGNNQGKTFDFSRLSKRKINSMKDFLDTEGEFDVLDIDEYTLIEKNKIKVQNKSGLIFCGYRNKKIRVSGVRSNTEHLSRVHKQPNRIYDSNGTHPTISSQEQSGRYWIKVDNIVRKLTLNECFRFMAFPSDFIMVGSKSKLYERIGNSICVNMIKEIAQEVKSQFWNKDNEIMEVRDFLESIYIFSTQIESLDVLDLNNKQKDMVNDIVSNEEILKGVFTVLMTSLVYKCLNPNQDVRNHQRNMAGGYSGRSFDTNYITPFLKEKKFLGAMKESGWLTRSLEQNLPYTLDFPGKINNKKVKNSFLSILDDVEREGAELANKYLKAIMHLSIKEKEKKSIKLINPITSESSVRIDKILDLLYKHFYYSYRSRGASILPVMALYSIYQCMLSEISRFSGKTLDKLQSHHSSDRSSGATGDIVVRNSDGTLYEVIEVKFGIPINEVMVEDAYNKFYDQDIQRYYILSTEDISEESRAGINKVISRIENEHGCQVIANGLMFTIKYYLRLLRNTDIFLENYLKNISDNNEINYEHKLSWNEILKGNK